MSAEKDRESASAVSSQTAMPAGAVFLSYASEDAAAAQQIATALRNAGIEVWIDQSELRGGDAWDRKIRKQIHDCALFVPLISQHSQQRLEGYFRLEWRLAVERTQRMATERPFLVPVVIDSTRDRDALVPDAFHEVQWTRLSSGETPPTFVERIRRLLAPDVSSSMPTTAAGSAGGPVVPPSIHRTLFPKAPIWIAAAIVALVCAYFVADKLWLSKYSITHASPTVAAAQQTAPSGGTAAASSPTAPGVRSNLADVLLRQGRLSEVLSEAGKESDERIRRISLPYLLNALGRSSDAAKALADAESRYGGKFPYDIGLDHAALGNFDRAFYWWERALRQHDPGIVQLLSAPLDTRQPTLPADPRSRALLHKMNLLE